MAAATLEKMGIPDGMKARLEMFKNCKLTDKHDEADPKMQYTAEDYFWAFWELKLQGNDPVFPELMNLEDLTKLRPQSLISGPVPRKASEKGIRPKTNKVSWVDLVGAFLKTISSAPESAEEDFAMYLTEGCQYPGLINDGSRNVKCPECMFALPIRWAETVTDNDRSAVGSAHKSMSPECSIARSYVPPKGAKTDSKVFKALCNIAVFLTDRQREIKEEVVGKPGLADVVKKAAKRKGEEPEEDFTDKRSRLNYEEKRKIVSKSQSKPEKERKKRKIDALKRLEAKALENEKNGNKAVDQDADLIEFSSSDED